MFSLEELTPAENEKLFQESYDLYLSKDLKVSKKGRDQMFKCVYLACRNIMNAKLLGVKAKNMYDKYCEAACRAFKPIVTNGVRPKKLSSFVYLYSIGVLWDPKTKEAESTVSLDALNPVQQEDSTLLLDGQHVELIGQGGKMNLKSIKKNLSEQMDLYTKISLTPYGSLLLAVSILKPELRLPEAKFIAKFKKCRFPYLSNEDFLYGVIDSYYGENVWEDIAKDKLQLAVVASDRNVLFLPWILNESGQRIVLPLSKDFIYPWSVRHSKETIFFDWDKDKIQVGEKQWFLKKSKYYKKETNLLVSKEVDFD